jgi:hypothetical protein
LLTTEVALRVQVDCFSYGVVLWEIVTKEQAHRGNWRPVLVPEECPAEVVELLQASLATLSCNDRKAFSVSNPTLP